LEPLRSSPALEAARVRCRLTVPARNEDRVLAPEIEALAELLKVGAVTAAAEAVCGRLM
jgi:histidine ammonia-lyase